MRFRMLGPLQVWNGVAWSPIRATQQRLLLAVLLIENGRVVSVDRLVDELWGARPPARAAATVQVYVGRLRRQLAGDPANPLVTRDSGYELLAADGDIDATVFEGLVTAARTARQAGELAAAIGSFDVALGLGRGPALPDVPATPAVAAQVDQWEQVRLGALEDRLGAELELGHHAEVVNELHWLVKEHPLRERLQIHYLTALYRSGRRAEALAAYQQARRVLVSELGLEPGPELRGLERAILVDDRQPPAAVAMPAGRELVPAQLPPVAAGFTGRTGQLKQLDALLDTDADAVVVASVSGTAGVGKTTLAVRWAHSVRDRFRDGQLYVDLRGYSAGPPVNPLDALAGFLRALGMAAEQIPSDIDEAATAYRSLLAGRRMLVLLDNACHPDQVRPLLPGNAGCLVLVTSRDRLAGLVARDGAVGIDLDALTPDEADQLLVRLLGEQRVAAEPAAVVTLADLCGHLPLALRIAAANLAAHQRMRLAGYADKLAGGDRLGKLQVPGDPQAGVRAAFDHSYTALPDGARRLFRLLGLVPGPDVSTVAAAALAGLPGTGAQRLLDQLVDAYLVDAYEPGRYRLHDLLRLYAAERAAAEEAEPDRHAALARLYEFYVHTAAAGARRLHPQMLQLPPPTGRSTDAGFDDNAGVLAWLDAERPNLVSAVRAAAADGQHEAAYRLADALRGYLYHGGHWVDWRSVAEAGLAAAEAAADPRARAAAHLSLGTLYWSRDGYPRAAGELTKALQFARDSGWVEAESAALGNLGVVRCSQGATAEAADYYAQALALDRRCGWPDGEATVLGNLGAVSRFLGRLDESVGYHRQSLEMDRRTGSRSGEASSLSNLGRAYQELGRLDDARAALTQAIAVSRAEKYPAIEGEALRNFAALHRDRGEHQRAVELTHAALAIAGEVGDRLLEAESLTVRASIHLELASYQPAARDASRALAIAGEIGGRFVEVEALLVLAAIRYEQDQLGEAAAHAERARTIAGHCGYRILEDRALARLTAVADAGPYERVRPTCSM